VSSILALQEEKVFGAGEHLVEDSHDSSEHFRGYFLVDAAVFVIL